MAAHEHGRCRVGPRYEVGDDIALTEDDFRGLAKAFLSEIEIKFPG